MGHGTQLFRQVQYFGNFRQIRLSDGGVDLEFQAGGFGVPDATDGIVKRMGQASELIMRLRRRTVQADADALDPGSFSFSTRPGVSSVPLMAMTMRSPMR